MSKQRISLLYFLLLSFSLYAQEKQQVWLDYQLDKPFANRYLFEGTATYQTVMSQTKKWRAINVEPSFEYLYFPSFDFIVATPFTYTLQKDTTNSFDLSPSVQIRYHISQGKKVNARILTKFEHRFYKIEGSDLTSSNRIRLKAEFSIALNGPNMFNDNLWYLLIDYEEFLVLDQQVQERFANRRRARLGVGYRLDYRNRFEVILTRQSSRNELEDEFISDDNILQLRYKMFLNPSGSTAKKL